MDLLLMRRAMMAQGAGRRLPAAYQEVAYLITDGVAFITLQEDFYSALPGFEVKFRKTQSVDQYGPHIISHGAQNIWAVPRPFGNGMVNLRTTQTSDFGTNFPINTDFTLSMGADGTSDVYVNGVFAKSATIGTSNSSGRLGLFYYPGELKNRWKFKGWCYYVKIYDSHQLAYDLVPCYRIADNAAGLYCLKHSTFYINSNGSGAFSVGPNI